MIIKTLEEAIEVLKDLRSEMEDARDRIAVNAINMVLEAVKEPKHGEWINKDYGIGNCWATCSECRESTNGEAQDHGFGYDYSFPNFCPNCGASMRKEGDEK